MFQFSGNVGQDAAVKSAAGKQVMEFSVGVYAGKKDGQAQTLWVKCAKWFNDGYQIPDYEYVKKGDTVIISGVPSPIRLWEANGKNGAELGVSVDKVERIKKSEGSGSYQATQPSQPQGATLSPPVYAGLPPATSTAPDDDLPF